MNIPAQLVIGSYIFDRLLKEDKNKFKFYKTYNNIPDKPWLGDNYFYDEEDLLEFWGVDDLNKIDGSVYVRHYDNLTKDEEKLWKGLGLNGSQVKIYWC